MMPLGRMLLALVYMGCGVATAALGVQVWLDDDDGQDDKTIALLIPKPAKVKARRASRAGKAKR